MRRGIILAGLLMGVSTAHATTYYVSDCQAGAVGACVAGKDSNLGTDPGSPWKTFDKFHTQFGSLETGDHVLFARGGAFTATGVYYFSNSKSRAGNPIVVADYTPTWGAGAGRPIITDLTGNLFALESSGLDEGFTFQNLDLRGGGTNQAFFLYDDLNDVTLDNLDISGFGMGVHCEPGSRLPNRVRLTNSHVFNNGSFGWLGEANDLLIENNVFDNNGFATDAEGAGLNHNVYVSGVVPATGIVIRGNSLTHSAVVGGRCGGDSMELEGILHQLLVENNLVQEDIGGASGGCYGIAVNPGYNDVHGENFQGAIIRGNRVINVGANGFNIGACPDCIIENNVVVQEQTLGFGTGIAIPSGVFTPDDLEDTNVTVRNNSIYFGASTTGVTGISLGGTGTSHVFVNNAVHYAGSSNDVAAFQLNLSASAYEAVDNNLFYAPNASGARWERSTSSSLSQWRSIRPGFDVSSLQANPGFASPGTPNHDLSIPASSPAVNAGNVAFASPVDITGRTRDAHPDIGAYEYVSGATLSIDDASTQEGDGAGSSLTVTVHLE
jgi:hypothetical protein